MENIMEQFRIVTSKSVKFIYLGDQILMYITDQSGKEYQHRFGSKSKFYKEFLDNDINAVVEAYTNAPFVFLGDDLVDFRNNKYNGFIHQEDVLNQIAEELGIENQKEGDKRFIRHRKKHNKFVLGSKVFSFEFQLDENSNNTFASKLSFPFDPFKPHVDCFVGLERLVCLNGMVTNSSIFNYKIPIINNVSDNLRVAMRQLSPSIRHDFETHVSKLQQESASLSETMRTQEFVKNRIDSDLQNLSQMSTLSQLSYVCDVRRHCPDYDEEIFSSSAATFYPSHLKRYDIWNILTELDSHTNETDKSTSVAVQRYANTILFNSATFHTPNERASNLNRTSRFDHDNLRALWGSNGSGF